MHSTTLQRRHLMALAVPALTGLRPGSARATPDTQPDRLLVAGPPGGRLDRWAELLAPAIARAIATRPAIERRTVGGLDGVTGANQFEARGEPDGSTALLVPGSAALSWLAGETRAHFDPGRWVPLWASTASAVLVSRQALVPGSRLLVAAASPIGPDLPILLALDLMGIDVALAPAGAPPGTAGATLVQGERLLPDLLAASGNGFQPVLTLGIPGPDGRTVRDPALTTVPTVFEAVEGRAPAGLTDALHAAAAAVRLDAGLVLPALTPASAVALWRSACNALQRDAEIQAQASRLALRIVPADAVANSTTAIAGTPAMQLALRSWLATRFDWRPT